jgi:putative ABC transport system permease protein
VFLNFIACANVSNLFLARGFSRRGEFATRLALGASRVRLVRQLLVEALLLAAAAGLVGVAVSMVLPEHILADIPGTSVVRIDARPDIRVFIWTSALAALVCLLFGLGPALRTTRLAVSQVLKDTNGNAPSTLKTSLPAMQALVSVFALAIAGFVLRSEPQMQARRMERSFDGLTVVRVAYPADFDASRRASTARDVLEGLRSTSSRSAPAAADREPGDDARQKHAVSPSYFPMLGMPLMAGRTFHEDGESGVAVVNESFARAEWGDASALGRRVKATETDASGLEVIGVVRDGVHAQPAWFVSLAAADLRVIYVAEAEEAVRLRAARMSFSDGTGPSLQVGSGAEWSRRAFPGQAFSVKLFTEFGFFALALAILGLFGLSDHAIRQRTREIGVRAVLGAGPLQILEAVMRPALRALVTGTAAGLVLSLAAGVLLRRLQFPEGVHPFDNMVFIVVSFTMAGAGLVALAWPARRALRVRPAEALRYE